MSEFEYLAVFIAIVAGLSVAQTLSGLVRLVHCRRTMRIDTVHLLWTANLLVWLINWWWFSFSLVGLEQWTGGYLLYVLLYPTTIYFLLALLYPSDMPASFDAYHPHIYIVDKWIKQPHGIRPSAHTGHQQIG